LKTAKNRGNSEKRKKLPQASAAVLLLGKKETTA